MIQNKSIIQTSCSVDNLFVSLTYFVLSGYKTPNCVRNFILKTAELFSYSLFLCYIIRKPWNANFFLF